MRNGQQTFNGVLRVGWAWESSASSHTPLSRYNAVSVHTGSLACIHIVMDTVQINLLKPLYRGSCKAMFAEPLCAYELGHVPSFTRVFYPAAHQDQLNRFLKDDKDFYEQTRACLPVLQMLTFLGRQCVCICKITHIKLLAKPNTNSSQAAFTFFTVN